MFKNGKLTVNSAMYLTHILISFVMGITAPITIKFFTSHELVTTSIINITNISAVAIGSLISWLATKKVVLEYFTRRFIPISILVDTMYFLIAFYGENHPVERYIFYKIVQVMGVDILKKVQKRLVNLSMKGVPERLTLFQNKCEYYAKISGLFGGGFGLLLYMLGITLSVSCAMTFEFGLCLIAHLFQIYANKRIQRDVLKISLNTSFVDAVNDIFRTKIKRKSNIEEKDPFDI